MTWIDYDNVLDKLTDPGSECFEWLHRNGDLNKATPSTQRAVDYMSYAVDHLGTAVIRATVTPFVAAAGATTHALRQPGAGKAQVLVLPAVALTGGVVLGGVGAVVNTAWAVSCAAGSAYHITKVGYWAAAAAVYLALETVQAALKSTQATVRGTRQGIAAGLDGAQSFQAKEM